MYYMLLFYQFYRLRSPVGECVRLSNSLVTLLIGRRGFSRLIHNKKLLVIYRSLRLLMVVVRTYFKSSETCINQATKLNLSLPDRAAR